MTTATEQFSPSEVPGQTCAMSNKKIPEFAIYNFDGSWQVGYSSYLKAPLVDVSRFNYGNTVLIKTKTNAKETTYVCKVMLFGGKISFCYLIRYGILTIAVFSSFSP